MSSNTLWITWVRPRLGAVSEGPRSPGAAPVGDESSGGWRVARSCSGIAYPLLTKMVPQGGQRARILAKDSVVVGCVVDMQRRIRHGVLDLNGARNVRLSISVSRHEQGPMRRVARQLQ